MRIIGLLFTLLLSISMSAQNDVVQNLQRQQPGKGRVTIHQDEAIAKLVGSHHSRNVAPPVSAEKKSVERRKTKSLAPSHSSRNQKIGHEGVAPSMSLILDDMDDEAPRKVVKVAGYRVQVYAGNNTRNAKLEALRMASSVRDYYPEVSVYTFFSPPRWLCRVGDFRSMEEAYSMMRKLKSTRAFHEVSIVKDRVNVSL